MTSEQVLPDPSLPWPIEWAGVVLIAMREGLRLVAYPCEAGVLTLGWGETEGIHEGMAWSKEQADAKLCEQLTAYTTATKAMCTRAPNVNQLAGLVSCDYNIGLEAMRGSTMLKQHNLGNFDNAARAFGLWNEYRDPKTKQLVVSPGLTLRRAQEKALYLTPIPDETGAISQDTPQAVAPESSLARSPINVSSITAGVAAAVPLLSNLGDQADKANTAVTQITTATQGVKGLLAEFDLTPVEVFCPIAIIAAGVACWWRWKQRSSGFA